MELFYLERFGLVIGVVYKTLWVLGLIFRGLRVILAFIYNYFVVEKVVGITPWSYEVSDGESDEEDDRDDEEEEDPQEVDRVQTGKNVLNEVEQVSVAIQANQGAISQALYRASLNAEKTDQINATMRERFHKQNYASTRRDTRNSSKKKDLPL